MTAPAQPPLLDAAALRESGRAPPLPARLRLSDGRELELLQSLRLLPGKRLSARARLDGQTVLAKLFFADGAARHAARELAGLTALLKAGLPTPSPLADVSLTDGGELVATGFLEGSRSLAEEWQEASLAAGDSKAVQMLTPALALLARMHAAGLTQSDLHLGNFLRHERKLYVIDGDAVEQHAAPLPRETATANLAILLAQFPPAWDACTDDFVAVYVAAGGLAPEPSELRNAMARVRERRLADILAKSVRDCTLFAVQHNCTRFTSVVREESEALASLLENPDAAIQHGDILKNGNTATVARIELGGRARVVKRYNLKNLGHALSRAWRPSRAWHAWQAAHHLQFLGIATPRPLALVEERLGPLRRRAWLITAHCPGPNLLELLDADQAPPENVARALRETFTGLYQARVHHGDLKATNLLWHDGRMHLIDLDATTAHRSQESFQRAWARDRARLIRNWPDDSALAEWLDEHLPAA